MTKKLEFLRYLKIYAEISKLRVKDHGIIPLPYFKAFDHQQQIRQALIYERSFPAFLTYGIRESFYHLKLFIHFLAGLNMILRNDIEPLDGQGKVTMVNRFSTKFHGRFTKLVTNIFTAVYTRKVLKTSVRI